VSACVSTPISWLRLERYHAGELGAAEREEIAAHLASCEACAACLRTIEADDARALPPLPVRAAAGRRNVVTLRRAAPVAFALAAAAVLVLVLRVPRDGADRYKGGEVSFTLVREDEALVVEAGGSYRDGERIKALVTCPPEMRAAFDLVVYENGEAAFPLPPIEGLACGNDVPFPGAFRLTGRAPMRVCLAWNDEGGVDRDALRRAPPRSEGAAKHALCKELTPAP
jgi:hypothetical protein